MPIRLVPMTPNAAPIVILQRPVLLIGRHRECDVRIDLPQISRRHCCLAQAYDRLLIRDLGSRNGVRVNGRKVDEAPLRPGDEVAIGQVIYRLEEAAPPDAPTPARATASPPPARPKSDSLPEIPLDPDEGSDLIPLDDLTLD